MNCVCGLQYFPIKLRPIEAAIELRRESVLGVCFHCVALYLCHIIASMHRGDAVIEKVVQICADAFLLINIFMNGIHKGDGPF